MTHINLRGGRERSAPAFSAANGQIYGEELMSPERGRRRNASDARVLLVMRASQSVGAVEAVSSILEGRVNEVYPDIVEVESNTGPIPRKLMEL